jgi:glycosyltransferase involved in cell wall biosynthesis
VNITKGFLDQSDIAVLHKEHGVFLSPTRFDSQGVSMCEAMSSGLVPVTTNVAAIPEFVDHGKTGLLAPPEDYLALANWIERLYFNSELFERLSENASSEIRRLCSEDVAIKSELDLILDRGVV